MKAILRTLFFPLLTIVLVVGAFIAAAVKAAHAAPQCGPAEQVMTTLAGRFGERALFVGKLPDDRLVTITVAPDGTTWTAIVEGPKGTYCLMAAGPGWSAPAPAPAGELN